MRARTVVVVARGVLPGPPAGTFAPEPPAAAPPRGGRGGSRDAGGEARPNDALPPAPAGAIMSRRGRARPSGLPGTGIMICAMVVALGSLPIIWLSRRSLLRPASHGFPRFFAFEAILALVAINAPRWFVEPVRTQQVISWLLLTVSAVFLVWGVVLLRRFGRSRPRTESAPEFQWENTTNVVTTGIYGYIRHPMYSSLLFLTWGALLKSMSAGTFGLAVMATLALAATAIVEERENLARFGDEYREYMKRTRRFVPFVA